MPVYHGPSGSPGYRHDNMDPTGVDHIDHTPRKEVHYGQPLPGNRGIYDHSVDGYTPHPYDGDTTPNDVLDYENIKDDYQPDPTPVAPIPVKIVNDAGIERKLFRTSSYVLGDNVTQLGAHATRQKMEIWSLNSAFRLSYERSMFNAVWVGQGNTITISSTEPVYVDCIGSSATVNVLEHYNANVAEQ